MNFTGKNILHFILLKNLKHKIYVIRKGLILIATLALLSCLRFNSDQSIPQGHYFMKAGIDSKIWETEGQDKVIFDADFNFNDNRFTIGLGGNNLFCNPPDDYGKMISFSFGFVPVPGRYFFNNKRDLSLDSGITATYAYWNVNRHDYKWSSEGYIDINTISIDSISGRFSFKAAGSANNADTTTITDGSFNALYVGSSGKVWRGPQ
jgi:hypothetical protein